MNNRRLNGKALFILLLSAAALAGGTHLAHAFQVKRNAAAMIDQAGQAELEGKSRQAAYYLRQYISLEPDDTDGRARYALLLKKLATNHREQLQAFLTLEEVLRRDAKRADVRRAAAELGVKVGSASATLEHLKILLADTPDDAELTRLLGWCELREARTEEAAKCFVMAGQLAPEKVELCVEVATALRKTLRKPLAADQVIEQMILAVPRDLTARLEAARYYFRADTKDQADKKKCLDQADTNIRFAMEVLHGRNPELPLLAAELAMARVRLDGATARARMDEARGHLERGLKDYPGDPQLSRELARLELSTGHKEKATELVNSVAPETSNNPRDLWAQATLYIDVGQNDRAEAIIKQLTAQGGPLVTAMVAHLRGQMSVRNGAWGEARVLLEKARSTTQSEPQINLRVNLLLADCYRQQGNSDQLLNAYRQVLKDEQILKMETGAGARRGLAAALMAIGKTQDSIDVYRALAVANPTDPQTRVDLARALLTRTRRRPAPERDWTEFDQLMQEIKTQGGGDPSAISMLQFDALMARDKTGNDARRLMELERDRDPKQVAPWQILIALAAREKSPGTVTALLAEAEKQTGWHVEWELAKASQAVRSGGAEAPRELQRIEARAEKCPDADKARLSAGLAEAYQLVGDRVNGRRLWKQAAGQSPGNITLRFTLFELALQDGDAAEADRLRGEIRSIEGAGGPVGFYCEAACHLLEVRKGDKKEGIAAARRALAQAAEQRPTWSRVALLDAEFCELEGRKDKALEKYQEAMDHGDGRLPVVRRILELLYEQHRFAEAHLLLRKVPEPALSQTDLGRIAAQLLAASPEDAAGLDPAAARMRALQLARQSVSADSKDYRKLLWLGHIAAQTGKLPEAEQAFRKAVEVADTVPDTWASLALFLAQSDAKKADAELERAKTKLSKDQLPMALAPCYEVLGRTELADQQYQAALAAHPTDSAVLRAAAAFYSRTGQTVKATPILRRIVDDPQTQASATTKAWARRALAVSLPVMGNYHQFTEAVALVDANTVDGQASVEDRLTKALLLASQPVHRKEAIGLFETLPVRQNALPPDAQFLLAQLYEADGDWPKARANLLGLVNEHDKNPVYHVGYARALLRHDAVDEARTIVNRLAVLSPDAYETAELRARVLNADSRVAAAVDVVRAFANAGKGQRLVLAASLLEELGRPEDAEPLYREYAATAGKPDAVLPLAGLLSRTGRIPEALTICDLAWKTCPPMSAARVSVIVVRKSAATDEQRRRVEKWLLDGIAKNPQMLGMRVLLADLYDAGGRHDEAVALYRHILDEVPGNVIALNNLAFLLAVQGVAGDEPTKLIKRAIDIAGPLPDLLDTRAVVYLRTKQNELAVKDLQQAVAQAPLPTAYYHLAVAQMASKNRAAANEALRKAGDTKLKASDLHPLEQAAYRELSEVLKYD